MNPVWHFLNGVPNTGAAVIGGQTINSDGITLASAGVLAWSTDLKLVRAAANTLGQVNGTANQEFRVGPTSSYLRLFKANASFGVIGTLDSTELYFQTNQTDRMYLSTAGHLLFSGAYNIGDGAGNSPVNIYAEGLIKSYSATAGIGYGTGAGGTVTQGSGSGKATGVTLNTVTGQITMDGASLAAATIVSFTLTNSAIAADDHILVTHISGGTVTAYAVSAGPGGAGNVAIHIRNNTAGALAEAIVIKYSVFKSVIA